MTFHLFRPYIETKFWEHNLLSYFSSLTDMFFLSSILNFIILLNNIYLNFILQDICFPSEHFSINIQILKQTILNNIVTFSIFKIYTNRHINITLVVVWWIQYSRLNHNLLRAWGAILHIYCEYNRLCTAAVKPNLKIMLLLLLSTASNITHHLTTKDS